MSELVAIALHPTQRVLALSESIADLQEVARAYLEQRYGWVDELNERWFYSKHELHLRHLRSPRIDFFRPDVIIQDRPK